MQIDWFTLIAQIVNFLILVIVLRALLYKRIIKTMDERERRIAESISNAEEKEAKAEEIEREYRNKRDEIEREKDSIIVTAKEDAEKRSKEMISTARDEIEQKKSKWLETLRRDKENFVKQLNREASERVLATARKVLREMADEGLNSRIVEKFGERLQGLPDDEIAGFSKALEDANRELTIISAFDLTDEESETIQDALKERFGDIEATVKTESDKIAGIEVRAGGKKIEWSIEEYIEELQESVRIAFEEMTEERKEESETEDG